jgi:hypothetical protein
MKFALVISSLVAAAFAQTINTPESVLSCANHQVTFSGGTAPYTILVIPGGDSSAAAIETYHDIQCSPFTWFVTEAAGTSVFLRLQDNAGASVSTAPFTIQTGSGNGTCTAPTGGTPQGSCSAGSTVTGGGGGGAATTAAPTGGAATTGGGAGTTPAPSGTSGGSGSGSTTRSTSSTQSTGAAFSNQVSIAGAVVGVVAMGLAVLA